MSELLFRVVRFSLLHALHYLANGLEVVRRSKLNPLNLIHTEGYYFGNRDYSLGHKMSIV